MSLIDRLSKEAKRARETRELSERERLQREEQYQSDLQGRMMALHGYLEQLIAHLKELQPTVRLNYQLSAYGDLPAQMLHEFKLEAERRMLSYVINISWRARIDNENCRELKATGHTRVRQLIDQFRALHLGGISEIKQGAAGGDLLSATFHPKGFIHISMRAILHAHDPILRLSFENLDTLGTTHKQFPGEEVDDNLFDRIGRFLVREDNELIMEALPEALRQRLRGDDQPASMIPAAHHYDPDHMVAVDLAVDFDPDSVPRDQRFDVEVAPTKSESVEAKPGPAAKPGSKSPPPAAAEAPPTVVEQVPPEQPKTKAERDFELLHSASPKAPAPDEERVAQLIAEFEAAQLEQGAQGDEVRRPQIQPLSMSLLDDEPAPTAAAVKPPAPAAQPAPAATRAESARTAKPASKAAERAPVKSEASADPIQSQPDPAAASAASKPEAADAGEDVKAKPAAVRKPLDVAELEAKRREAEAFRDRMRQMAEKLRQDQ